VFVDGNVPPEGAGGLDIVIENFQAADLAALAQTDLDFRGLISTTARIEGTPRAPIPRRVRSRERHVRRRGRAGPPRDGDLRRPRSTCTSRRRTAAVASRSPTARSR
jgi:hypothetical protein